MPTRPVVIDHLTIGVSDLGASRRFYLAALAAGATDNGRPGVRPEYSAGYYGAFVLDPDGYNVEAVYHEA